MLYASILPIINLFQNEDESGKIISEFKILTKRFCNSSDIAYQYAATLAVMALHEDSEAYENIMTEFNFIINRFSENKEIALLSATTVANISHDLRSPLTSIQGFLSAVLDGTVPDDKKEEYLNIVSIEAIIT